MNNDTTAITDLIRRMIECFIDHRETLSIVQKDMPGRVDWKLKVHADDYGKVAGRGGSHIMALQFIVAEFGLVDECDYRLQLLEPDPTTRRGRSPEKKVAEYDHTEAQHLLNDILTAILDNAPTIASEQTKDLTGTIQVKFFIQPENRNDLETLCTPFDDNITKTTLLTALGTIFRAYGNCEGVTFNLTAPTP